MRDEVERLYDDIAGSVRFTRQEGDLIKAALLLAYQVGVRDGCKDAMDTLGSAATHVPSDQEVAGR